MKLNYLIAVSVISMSFFSCGGGEESSKSTESNTNSAPVAKEEVAVVAEVDPMENVGIGPIDELEFVGEVDADMAEQGKTIFEAKCTACHKVHKRYIGPSPAGIYERRNPAWVMNMILNPDDNKVY